MGFITSFLKKKIVIFLVSILIFGLIVIGLIWQFIIQQEKTSETSNQLSEEEDKLSTVFEMGQKARLGSLEITLYDFKESSYVSSELDENYRKITKKYFAPQIKVFNSSFDKTEHLLIGLVDNFGNEYPLDLFASPYKYDPNLKRFGRNMEIYPRIMQEGYIFFPDIDEKAKEFQLIFAITSTKEKVVFKIQR